MRKKILNWLYWGYEYAANTTEKRKIFNTNVATLIAYVSITFYGAIYIATGNPALIKSALSYLPYYGIYALIPWLNRQGKTQLASWFFCFSLTAVIFTTLLVAQGNFINLHYYFILFAIVPTMFFSFSQWKAILFFFVLNISAFLFAEHGEISPDPEIYQLTPWIASALRDSFLLTSLITLLFIVWLSEYTSFKNEIRLEIISSTDGLTEIANRRQFDNVLKNEWNRALRTEMPLAVGMIDVDWFKKYNDLYGHQVGDECLRQVAATLASNIARTGDLVARYGGEEFVFIAPASNDTDALSIAQKACMAIRSLALPHEGTPVGYVTVSIGVASMIPRAGDTTDTLLQRADAALYHSKEQGRNQVTLASQRN